MPYSVFTQLDAGEEKSATTIHNGAITAVSIGGFLTEFGQMRAAIEGITLGTMHKEQWVGDNTILSQTPPANQFAQREMKWLVSYQGDTSQKLYSVEIPCADLALLIPGTENIDMDNAAVQTFVNRFNSFARTPDSDLETVTIINIKFVGRNS